LIQQRGQLEAMTVVMLVGSYQQISIDELTKYEQFINSDAGRVFIQSNQRELILQLEESMLGWLKDIMKMRSKK